MTKTYINPDSSTGIELSLENLTYSAISPTQLSANTDNWNPTSLATASIIRASTDASRNLTGIVAPAAAKLLVLENIGAFDLVIKHDVTSTAANRFYCPNDTDVTLQKDASIVLQYDMTSARWRVVGGTGSGSGSALSVSEVDGSPIDTATTGLVFPNDSVTFAGHVATVRQVPLGFIGASAYHHATQNMSNATMTAMLLDSEVYDTDGFHSTSVNTSRMTIPAGLGGKYLVEASVSYAATANGFRYAAILKNGVDQVLYVNQPGSAASFQVIQVSAVVDLVPGDYIEAGGFHDSGGTVASSADKTALRVVKLDAGRVGSGVGAKAYAAGTQTINNTTATLALDGTEFDTDGFVDLANDRLVVPAGMSGKYLVAWRTHHPPDTAASSKQAVGWLRKNGATTIRGSSGGHNVASTTQTMEGWELSGMAFVDLVAGDYVDVQLFSVANMAFGHATQEYSTTLSIMRLDSKPADDPVWVDWTPTIKAGATTLSFTTVVARYIKIGKVVHWYIRVRGCTVGGTGVISITGMPANLQDTEGSATGGVLGSGIWQDEGVEWLHFDMYFASQTDWRMKKYNDFTDLSKTVGTSPADSFTAQGFIALA
jgi:hypothetical protein